MRHILFLHVLLYWPKCCRAIPIAVIALAIVVTFYEYDGGVL